MSLGIFFKHLWDGIKGLFDNLSKELKNAIHIGVVVTENIKKFTIVVLQIFSLLSSQANLMTP